MTQGEILVWGIVRNKKLGYKFLKQKPIGRFVLDFYCSELLLAIEVDGGSHEGRGNYDEGRDELLKTRGIKTVRLLELDVTNNVLNTRDGLVQEIHKRESELGCSPSSRGAPEG